MTVLLEYFKYNACSIRIILTKPCIKMYELQISKLFTYSLVVYGFDCDMLVQNTKLGTLISYNVLIDFRRGATLKLLGTPLFCSLKHFNRKNKMCYIYYRFWQLNSSLLRLNSSLWQLNSSCWQLNSSPWLLNSSLWHENSSVTRLAAAVNMKIRCSSRCKTFFKYNCSKQLFIRQ